MSIVLDKQLLAAIRHQCSADCPRFREGTCPYRMADKYDCPRIAISLAMMF